jgi:hypothetical protein
MQLKIQEKLVLGVKWILELLLKEYSLRTLYRWRQETKKKAQIYLEVTKRRLFSLKPDIEVNILPKETRILPYLNVLWNQVPNQELLLSEFLNICWYGKEREKIPPQFMSLAKARNRQV